MAKLKRVLVYKNTDGFLTEDLTVYKKRATLLGKIAKKKNKESALFRFDGDYTALQYWSVSKEVRDEIDHLEVLKIQDDKNCCSECNGSGKGEYYTDEYGSGHEPECQYCRGGGLAPEYTKKTGRRIRHQNCFYIIKHNMISTK